MDKQICPIVLFADTYKRTVFNSLANRKRAPGGGRKPTLKSIEEKLGVA